MRYYRMKIFREICAQMGVNAANAHVIAFWEHHWTRQRRVGNLALDLYLM